MGFARRPGCGSRPPRHAPAHPLLSQRLPLQYQLSTDLLHTTFVSASGIVVTYPPLGNAEIREVVAAFAASRRLKPAVQRPATHQIGFDPAAPSDRSLTPRPLFGTRVVHRDEIRGSFHFDRRSG